VRYPKLAGGGADKSVYARANRAEKKAANGTKLQIILAIVEKISTNRFDTRMIAGSRLLFRTGNI
jgi:hypothetical protein